MSSDLASSKQMISVSIKKRFRNICQVRESDERFCCTQKLVDVLWKNPLYRKLILDSTYNGLKNNATGFLYLSDLEMNWTSSFLVLSDKLALVLHLLLAPEGTVVKPAGHEVVRHQIRLLGRCRHAFR